MSARPDALSLTVYGVHRVQSDPWGCYCPTCIGVRAWLRSQTKEIDLRAVGGQETA